MIELWTWDKPAAIICLEVFLLSFFDNICEHKYAVDNHRMASSVPNMKPLTGKQKKMSSFVGQYSRGSTFPLTLWEIGQVVCFANIRAIRRYLIALEKKSH